MNSILPIIRRSLLTACLLCFFVVLNAQVPQPIGNFPQHDHCATMYADSALRSKVPSSPSLMDFENWLQGEIVKQGNNPQNQSGRAAIITIPVIVHVVHNGDAVGSNENITAAQVYSQIDVLNQDFRRLNADTVNTPVGFRPVAADVEIEFCLALRSPTGQTLVEPGIDRVQRSEATWPNTGDIDAVLKPATVWDPNQYFNIWVVNFGGNGLLGYAQFPEGSGLAGMPGGAQTANSDGIVCLYNAFGRTGNVTSPYNRGRTTSHEVGHWLGLRHIWGDGGCGVDDFCNDTPDHDAENRGCTTGSVSCGTTEMVQNYMDYTNDACMNIFTRDQKTRMQTVMSVSPRRQQLRNSTVCTPLIQVTLNGQVRDASTLQGVPNALVRIIGVGNNFSYTATANATGNFTITVNQGTYNVYGGKWGYVTALAANRVMVAPSHSVTVDVNRGYYDDFIMNFGWTVSGAATTGEWERGAPAGTLNGTAQSNPGADVTNDFGSDAYVTGNAGGAAGTDDVDGFTTVLTSPVFDLTSYNLPYVSFYRWWYNDGGSGNMDDTLVVRLTNGVTTVVLDRIGPSTNSGNQWVFRNYNISSLIAPTANMRLTATTGDYGAGHLVEAGLDLFRVVDSLPNVNQPPTPLFTSTTPTICTGQSITFTDFSAGSPTSRAWTFQGGTPATSTLVSPVVTYNTPGTYNVTLISTNGFGSDTLIRTAYVTVTGAQTNFTSNITQGCGTFAVQFTDQSTCSPTAWSWSFPGGSPTTSTAQNPSVTYSSPGNYNVSLTVNGVTTTRNGYITVGVNGTILSEDFESNSFTTNGWTLQNPDNGITWAISTTGGNAPGTRSAGINLFNYAANTQRDGLISPILNLSNVSSTVLNFEHAHRRRSQTQRDSLIVYVSTDGGATWPNRVLAVGENGAGTFATNATVATNFIPAAVSDWCVGSVAADCFTINLGAFDGQANVRIRFESFNNVGNNIYLDDIVVSGCQLVPTVAPNAAFAGTPTTGCGSVTVQYTDQSTSNPTSWLWSFPGGTPATSALQNPSVLYSAPGIYTTTLIAINSAGRDTLVRNNYVTVSATPSLTVTGSNPLCAGQASGSATATVTGGTAPYTYVWTNNRNTATNSGIASGSYTVTVTDANGCSVSGSTTLTAPLAITASATTTPAFCGNSNGTATLAITGGVTPYIIAWSNGGTSSSITGLAAGSYSYTVTDNNGCLRTGSATVGANTTTPTLSFNIQNVSCNGGTNGSITVSATGGATPYTYAWGNGGLTNSISNLSGGNYSITVTDANGCSASTTVFVSQPAAIAINATTTPATCGNSNGSVSATVTGGTGPYTYAWSGSGTTASITNRASGTYTVTVTDSRSCTAVASFNISNIGAPSITINKQDASCNGGNNGSATAVISGGLSPYTILWSNTANTATANNLAAGTYTVSVTDANGCSSIASTTIAQPTAVSVALTTTNSSCGGNNGAIIAVGSGGTAPYTYAWSNGGNTATINNLAATNYTVTVTDSRGCTGTATATVTQLAAPTVSITKEDASCFGVNDGEATVTVVGGVSPYTYVWSGGLNVQTVTGLAAGNYTVTISDANTCTATATVAIGQPTRIVIGNTVADATCGNSDGNIGTSVSGGTPGYTYLWGSGQVSSGLTNLASGAYDLTVSDQNGCSADTTIVISNLGGPTVSLTTTNNNCTGQNNGGITAVVSNGTQPYAYEWSTGATAIAISNLGSGTYTLTVTDANGCIAVRTATISQPAQLLVQISKVDASCGIDNGQAGLLAVGGVAPYTYFWSTGSTQQQLFNLPQGTYAATITDGNGCQSTATTVIDSLPVLAVIAAVDDESCPGNNDGAINLVVSSGAAPISYVWSNGLTASGSSGLTPGNYNITITDASGCENVQNLAVTAANPLVLNAGVLAIVCSSKFGEATVSATGGAAPYEYLWNTNDSLTNLLVVQDGTYSVTVTDANGCQQSTSVLVPRSSGPTLSTSSTADTLGNANGTATVAVDSGSAPFIFDWSDGQSTSTATNLAAGTYLVTVTDADGCDAVDSVTVNFFSSIGTGISENNITLWPNPSSGKFVVNFNGIAGVAAITVFDAVGKLVMSQENDILATSSVEMDLTDFAGGVYMVRINHEGQTLHYRVVLTK